MKFAKLSLACFTLLLGGCATTGPNASNSELTEAEQQVIDQLSILSQGAVEQTAMTRVSHCRYEFSHTWTNPQSNLHSGTLYQRIDFTHDLRSIERVPAHAILYSNRRREWGDTLRLLFNREVPDRFEYVNTRDYRERTERDADDKMTVASYASEKPEVVEQLRENLTQLARLCGADIDSASQIDQKVQGRWAWYEQEHFRGRIHIGQSEATIAQGQDLIAQGPYTLQPTDDYHLLIVNPDDPEHSKTLLLDFVSSNHARLLMLDNPHSLPPFAPYGDGNNPDHNPDERHLFRLGDMR